MSPRHRSFRTARVFAAATALAVAMVPSALADTVDQDDIDEAKKAESQTSSSIADLEVQLAQLKSDLQASQIKAASANEDYLEAAAELEVATTAAADAQTAADDAAAATETARSSLGATVVETYQDGGNPLDALTPYLSSESLADATDTSVALTRVGENRSADLQNFEAHQAVAENMRSIAQTKVAEKETAATNAQSLKATADAEVTKASTAVADAKSKRESLISQLATQRNTTVELETQYQDRLEAERQAREEAAAKTAAEEAARKAEEEKRAQASASPAPTAPPTPSPSPSQSPSATPTPEATTAPATTEAAPATTEAAPETTEAAPAPAPETEVAPEPEPAPAVNVAQTAIDTSYTFLGVPYVWGGESYDGVDCSGLVMLSYQAAGVYLTHSSRVQYGEGAQVPIDEAQPGDLVFWSSDGTQSGIYHVAIYLGDDQMIEAPTFGVPVRVTGMRYSGVMPYVVRF